MKTIVENQSENTRTPFLRGILTRSLLDAGLEFEQAFELATVIRDDLAKTEKITVMELRQRVLDTLDTGGYKLALEQYRLPITTPAPIQVHSLSGTSSAFSRGRHVRYLQSTGMKAERAQQTTALIYDQLLQSGVVSISTSELGYLTFLFLQQAVSKRAARRYLVWTEFQRSDRPLLLLICGTVGTGKSTIATEVAHLLEIVRIQSTDMLREVMRMMMPERLLPVLHTSSFNAWKMLPIQDKEDHDLDQMVAEGYRSQAELLAVPCEAILQRAVEESVPVILEGVHVHPELMKLTPGDSDMIKIFVMMAVLKSKSLKSRLLGRGEDVPQRRANRYLNSLDSIWSLQSYLLSEADRFDVPIIYAEDKDKAVQQVIQQVNAELSRHFDGSPVEVIGSIVDELEQQAAGASWYEIVPLLRG